MPHSRIKKAIRPISRPFSWAAALAVVFGLGGGSSCLQARTFRDLPAAVQTLYQDGVPHTERTGEVRYDYDSARSFFPIGIYHALQGEFAGRAYDFGLLREAGFNTVLPWRDQSLERAAAAAAAHGLQIIWHSPTDAELTAFGRHPTVLGWDIDHEPSVAEPDTAGEIRLQQFVERRRQVRALSPGRAVFTVNSPSISPPRTALWQAWAKAGDIVSFWKYPFFDPPVRSLTGVRGLPEVTALAVEAGLARKPILYVAQAFRGHSLEWFFPDPAAARAMAYTALVHGATGIVWFSLDSFVTRNDDVIGIHPEPADDYGIELPGRRQTTLMRPADGAHLQDSRRLWQTVREINGQLAELTPILLAKTARRSYALAIAGQSVSPTPIRTLLKPAGTGYVLIAVNVDAAPVTARFSFQTSIGNIERLYDQDPAPAAGDTGWVDSFGPLAVRIYRLER